MFLFDNLLIGLLLVILIFVYLFIKSKGINFISGLGIIYLLFYLEASNFIILITSFFIVVFSYNFIKNDNVKVNNKFYSYFIILLLVFFMFPSVSAENNNSNNGVGNVIHSLEWVDKVGSIDNQPLISITGTDYVINDTGKLMAFLKIGENPVNDAVCYANVLYPNHNVFINHELMTLINKTFFDGIYFLDFVVQNVTGVYPVSIDCHYNSSYQIYFVDGFVNKTGVFEYDNDLISQSYYFDNDFYEVTGVKADCDGILCEFMSVGSLPVGWNNDLLDSAVLKFVGETDYDKGLINVSLYDIDNNVTYDLFSFNKNNNTIIYYVNLTDFNISNNFQLVFSMFDFENKKINFDELNIKLSYVGSYVDDLRGNDELVVSKGINEIVNVTLSDEPFVNNEVIINIVILILFIILLFIGLYFWSGILLFLWTFLNISNLYIGLILLFISFLLVYKGYKDKKK